MPMFTTSVIASSARTCSAYASMAFSVSCTCANGAASLPCRLPAGWRKSQCITPLPSVLLMGSPLNIASRCSAKPVCSASVSSKASVASSVWFFDRSANRYGALWLKRLARCTSSLKASRRSKSPNTCAWVCKAVQAGVWSHRMTQAFNIRASSLKASAQKARMPSASFSVAMASSFRARRNEASSKDTAGRSIALATSALSA